MRQRSTEIAIAVSQLLHAGPICATTAVFAVAGPLAEAAESKALTAEIPAQPLAQALESFRHQTGLQLIYVSSLIGTQRSTSVAAGVTADEGLTRLLQGTGLRFAHLSARSIRIFSDSAAVRETTPGAIPGEIRDEVIVTASRGAEPVQDVPITIQSINGEQLKQLNVTNTYDLLKYTTNVTFSGDGPGTGNIYLRGLGGSATGTQSQSTTAPFPNVSLYLDDQSMRFPARNNDVYLVDMERVEILEGPQGTLFGGGAQAGVIRYVTNKPQLEATSGEAHASYGITAGGDPNTSLNAVLNVPLVLNKLGVRAAIFSERRGGFIDNVPATVGYFPGQVPHDLGGNPTANNGAVLGDNTNSVDVHGLRISALWKINDSWDALLQQNYQDMQSDGYFSAYPVSTDGRPLQPYQVTTFSPASNKDRYESTSLTVNGKLGSSLDVVYSGSYLSRHLDTQQDYSNYLRNNTAAYYYACIGTGAGYFNQNLYPALSGTPLKCSAPVANWHDQTSNQQWSHELRFSTDANRRLRGLFGAYWEKFVIDDNMNFNYIGLPQCSQANLDVALAGGVGCFSAVGPLPGTFAGTPGLRIDSNTAFGEDVQRGYKQTAVFTSIDLDLLPHALTLTVGARWYRYDEFENGSEYFTNGGNPLVINHINGACTATGKCGVPINLAKTESGHQWRGTLAWHATADIMAYYTYSEGFNPGGFNRESSPFGEPILLRGAAQYAKADGNSQQWAAPASYDADTVINNEIGLKTEFLDHHLRFNLSAYAMRWKNVQQILFDPAHLSSLTAVVNGPSYTVKGFEIQFVARITDGLTIQGSSSVNSAGQSNAPCLISVGVDPQVTRTEHNPTPRGACITQIRDAPYTNPFGQSGSRPPFSPPWMFNVLARYDWAAAAYRPFVWLGASHLASMSNQPGNFPDGNDPSQSPPTTTLLRYAVPGYTTYDAGLGVSNDHWSAQIQGHNLANNYGPTLVSSTQFIKSEVPLRPRVVTLLLGYTF